MQSNAMEPQKVANQHNVANYAYLTSGLTLMPAHASIFEDYVIKPYKQ